MKITFALLTTLLLLAHTASGDTRYVTSNSANAELHSIEAAWNARFLNTSSDISGTLTGFSETATSPDGKVSVTLKINAPSYVLDFGELDFDPLDPMQETKCFYLEKVNKWEASGSGSVTIKTPAGQFGYSCSSVKLGIKNFSLSGNVAVTDLSLAFTNGVATIDSSDYYFTYNCSASQTGFFSAGTSAAGIPDAYRQLLNQKLKKPSSNFTVKSVGTARTKMKTTMVNIRKN